MELKRCPCLLLPVVLAGCVSHGTRGQPADTPLLASLRSGPFREVRHRAKRILRERPEFTYDAALEDAVTALGSPDHSQVGDDGSDIYYKTAGGPIWLCYRDDKLIKKAMCGIWSGATIEEMEALWHEVRDGKGWPWFSRWWPGQRYTP